jgi:hypothetical protein
LIIVLFIFVFVYYTGIKLSSKLKWFSIEY